MGFFSDLSERHERLKKRIHSTRVPLSKNGQRLMSVVYFSVPIVCGYYIMNWAQRRAEHNFALEVGARACAALGGGMAGHGIHPSLALSLYSCLVQEDKIRTAAGGSANRRVQQQNEQLRKLLDDKARD
ncbi:TPA: hypothetical protein N0F65_008482 [Lagenidium giganteum]|uniref:Uncharacterized protein n=1 Tax=Lagenidium giganteum TaxID=4803 RepID=A0AAV2Z622_9STRA|nr:TPA: hypothetical protein N0F65_008482 [Lagenidium giganteum]